MKKSDLSKMENSIPSVKHITAPKIQHHVTDDGPPSVKGVLKVTATLEQRP